MKATAQNDLPLFNQVRRAFLLFQLLAQHHRFSEGRDELSADELAKRLNFTRAAAEKAIKILAANHCIEVASVAPSKTVWRFVPNAKAPDEATVQTSALAR